MSISNDLKVKLNDFKGTTNIVRSNVTLVLKNISLYVPLTLYKAMLFLSKLRAFVLSL